MILAFDTATPATAVALCGDGQQLQTRDDPPRGTRPRHTSRLLPQIDELLERGGGWDAVKLIAVGVGPGTFTGLRIGIATARALASARGLPIVGVSTLRALALGGSEALGGLGSDVVLAVLDARRGEAFAAAWPAAQLETGDALLAPGAFAPRALAEIASGLGGTVLAVGDGAVEFRSILEPAGVAIPEDDSKLHRVTAVSHCRLAGTAAPSKPDQILPVYLRIPDAEIARRKQ